MKSLFVQLKQKKDGVKVTVWYQEFEYQESCHHVYLTKKIYKNGNRSTVPAFARATEQEVPYILAANTYFWSPSSSASGRRSNEERRNAEIAEFMRENREEAEKRLNELFSEFLAEGEEIKIDEQGAYLVYGEKICRFENVVSKSAIEKIHKFIDHENL